jgi:GNAT superfamily N-acetyltransferase
MNPAPSAVDFKPVTTETWEDLVQLFEGHGNPGYCWCTYWRLSSKDYSEKNSGQRRETLKSRVDAGQPVGILAYLDGQPAAWCSIGPRAGHERVVRARSIKKVDERPAWSITCFYISRDARGQGMMSKLLTAAVEYAAGHGAENIEAYPVEPEMGEDGQLNYRVIYGYMGYVSTYEKAGFVDVTPPDSKRRVVRLNLNGR